MTRTENTRQTKVWFYRSQLTHCPSFMTLEATVVQKNACNRARTCLRLCKMLSGVSYTGSFKSAQPAIISYVSLVLMQIKHLEK